MLYVFKIHLCLNYKLLPKKMEEKGVISQHSHLLFCSGPVIVGDD